MSGYRCFRCGKELSNELSVRNGIGPICSKKRQSELDADQRLSEENQTCHQGFTCYAPEHGHTTISRFVSRFHALAEQTGLPGTLVEEVEKLAKQYIDALGLARAAVEVPHIDVPPFGDPQAMRDLHLPIVQGPFGASVKMPGDYEEQYRRLKLSECAICPFGLDCREPWLRRNRDAGAYGWEWDTSLYQDLANSLEVLGLLDDGRDIQDIARAQHDKRFSKSKRAKRAAQNVALW